MSEIKNLKMCPLCDIELNVTGMPKGSGFPDHICIKDKSYVDILDELWKVEDINAR